jgi:hypothetical protein
MVELYDTANCASNVMIQIHVMVNRHVPGRPDPSSHHVPGLSLERRCDASTCTCDDRHNCGGSPMCLGLLNIAAGGKPDIRVVQAVAVMARLDLP